MTTLTYVRRPISYPGSQIEQIAFQKMLAVWHMVADTLAQQPQGVVAKLEGGWLFLGQLGDQVHLFHTPELARTYPEFHVEIPELFDGIDEDDLDDFRIRLEAWLQSPVYEQPLSADFLARAIAHNF